MKIPILILFLFFACSSPIEDPDPPTQPVWVNKSSPDAIIEYGIDSDNSFGERIVLMWHQNFDKDLSSYNIFRGELFTNSNNISSIIYEKITTIDPTQNFGLDTLYYDENINKYTTYYYYLIVEDLANNKSVPSDTISYKLIRYQLRLHHLIQLQIPNLLLHGLIMQICLNTLMNTSLD